MGHLIALGNKCMQENKFITSSILAELFKVDKVVLALAICNPTGYSFTPGELIQGAAIGDPLSLF